jgi:tetratricopeptide (TPR) repeat protein
MLDSARRSTPVLAGAAAIAAMILASPASAQEGTGTALDKAQRLFYNARYSDSVTVAERAAPADDDTALALDDVRSSALLFQIKRLLTPQRKVSASEALKRCDTCPELIAAFSEVTTHGQNAARERLKSAPNDPTALFFLGKLDLNYVWLQLGPLGRRTGWSEYWEARRSLDTLLKLQPDHVRARVARAWMEYIVDTKLPWGTEWIMGGGDRHKALASVREAAASNGEYYARAEAEFALWEMLVRERRIPQAREVAERLATRFPENPELAKFLDRRDAVPDEH